MTPNYARAFVTQVVKAANEERREVAHLISTGSVDRAGDIVEPKGADLSSFVRNPVVLANHDYSIESIIGKATDLRVTRDGITATTTFRETELAEAAFRLAMEGIGGWSIGFRPTSSHSIRDGRKLKCRRCSDRIEELRQGKAEDDEPVYIRGFHFVEWEMLEYSSVAIPMNQDIVNESVRRGLVSVDLAPKFFEGVEPEPTEVADGRPIKQRESSPIHPAMAELLGKRVARSYRILEASRRIDEIVRDL